MKAYIGIKYYEDYRNKEIINKISSALERNGYGTSCIVRDIQNHQVKYNPQELMKLTFKEIDECDLVVIDLSEKGVGLGIEAGYAFARNIPIITIADIRADISETLEGISRKVIFYNNIEDIDSLLSKL
ncbi:nucleoside 2-deoxyribosyltransferase [Tissierella pigra]|uniref:Nucleoside 2-deoxyribosyltransferase n=1 Tax=Tissierella pigra TaxID=2607614 RepID=A0A6N7XJB1_9FIRM|nr:nucleoside 2-deoxyribosyltransferase [Tissierella pigra]MBU5425597.1 nucleoside 2-deoxyribosyltransferase [Tissierella pigra]MSU00852.1 nucleoside 2-deoxyribosyltransferase [Tissierella pigra]